MEGRWELKGESIKVMGKMGDWDEKEKEKENIDELFKHIIIIHINILIDP